MVVGAQGLVGAVLAPPGGRRVQLDDGHHAGGLAHAHLCRAEQGKAGQSRGCRWLKAAISFPMLPLNQSDLRSRVAATTSTETMA